MVAGRRHAGVRRGGRQGMCERGRRGGNWLRERGERVRRERRRRVIVIGLLVLVLVVVPLRSLLDVRGGGRPYLVGSLGVVVRVP